MSHQVNFSTYSKELIESYKKVLSEKDPINWAIYSYDKQGNDLKLLSTGGKVFLVLNDVSFG